VLRTIPQRVCLRVLEGYFQSQATWKESASCLTRNLGPCLDKLDAPLAGDAVGANIALGSGWSTSSGSGSCSAKEAVVGAVSFQSCITKTGQQTHHLRTENCSVFCAQSLDAPAHGVHLVVRREERLLCLSFRHQQRTTVKYWGAHDRKSAFKVAPRTSVAMRPATLVSAASSADVATSMQFWGLRRARSCDAGLVFLYVTRDMTSPWLLERGQR
jgi:hypothetical protein